MVDARPTFPLAQRYTQRFQKQFSRPMTGHTPQKLPFFNAISCIIAVRSADFAYTRSIIVPFMRLFVNTYFQLFSQNFLRFFVKIADFLQRKQVFLWGGFLLCLSVGAGLDPPSPSVPQQAKGGSRPSPTISLIQIFAHRTSKHVFLYLALFHI